MRIKDYVKKYYSCVDLRINHIVEKVTDNSKEVTKNSVYIYTLNNEYKKYIIDAINKGAKTIIIDKTVNFMTDKNINIIRSNNPKADLSILLKLLYLEKYGKMPKLIGITGTTGKTTVSTLIYQALKNNNYDVLLIGSNGNFSYYARSEKKYPTFNTTPSLRMIYKLMSKNELSYDYVIIEVSSQSIVDGRINGLLFDYSIITNFDNEHLEYHHNYDDYKNTKARIIDLTKQGIILYNEMKEFDYFKNYSDTLKITCGFENADYNIKIIESNLKGNKFSIKHSFKDYYFTSNIIGDFNIVNLTFVFALLKELKFKDSEINNAFNKFSNVLGRVNKLEKKNRTFIIDYPHSIIALENILKFLNQNKKNRIITIIGTGGDRDKTRRNTIGLITSIYSDYVIFTEDNSRTEDVKDIVNDLIKDIKTNNYEIIYDRKKAIDKAVDIALENDIVAILGKGNENTIKKDVIIKHNDLEYLNEVLEIKYV